jgi:hypothetical protein
MSSALFWLRTAVIVSLGIVLSIVGVYVARLPHTEDGEHTERTRKIVWMPYRVMLARRRQQIREDPVLRRRSIADRDPLPIHVRSHGRG